MQRFFAHAIVSTLLVSLMLSGCYSSRSLAVLSDRDAVTIEQARYDALRAMPLEQLSAAEVADRDSLHRTQIQRDSVRAATAKDFDSRLLMRRDSIIADQAAYEVFMSLPHPELDQVESTFLRHQQMQREHTLALVEAELQDRHIDVVGTFVLTALIVTLLYGVVGAIALAANPIGGCCSVDFQ